jgi:hypothetical protein
MNCNFNYASFKQNNMKSKKSLYYVSLIYGVIVTLLMLLVIGARIIEEIADKGFVIVMKEIGVQFIEWDDPSSFFVMYIIGYAIIWWKPLWGSVIIIIGSLVFFITNINPWNLIFVLPTLLVGILYILYWSIKRKNEKNPKYI